MLQIVLYFISQQCNSCFAVVAGNKLLIVWNCILIEDWWPLDRDTMCGHNTTDV